MTASYHSDLRTFDGRDNRREVMILLHRLGSDAARARFISGLTLRSQNGFNGCRTQVVGTCDAVSAYYMLVGCCNELGVSIDGAARLLEAEVRRGGKLPS